MSDCSSSGLSMQASRSQVASREQLAPVRLGDGRDPPPIRLLLGRRRKGTAPGGLAHRDDEVLEATGGHNEEHPAAGVAYRISVGDVARAEDVVARVRL